MVVKIAQPSMINYRKAHMGPALVPRGINCRICVAYDLNVTLNISAVHIACMQFSEYDIVTFFICISKKLNKK